MKHKLSMLELIAFCFQACNGVEKASRRVATLTLTGWEQDLRMGMESEDLAKHHLGMQGLGILHSDEAQSGVHWM